VVGTLDWAAKLLELGDATIVERCVLSDLVGTDPFEPFVEWASSFWLLVDCEM